MTDAELAVEVAGAVATVVIRNPGRRNAMTPAMWRQLPVLLDGLEADPAVRVLVLTGADGTFCAGADLGDLDELLAAGDGSIAVAAEERLANFVKPTVAAVRGACVGGGCQLAVACDLRIAADDARFGVPPARLGLVYPTPTTRRLVRLVGPAAAKHLLFTGELVDADRALRIGLADELLPGADLAARIAGLTGAIAERSQLSVVAAKEIVDGRADDDRVAWWHGQVRASGEAREGVAAFHERRPPRFRWTPPAGR
ncbi:Enoyl-CoA hydratase/carnithine racemase [Micromonospora phaseoli]|uniref:Enoyl-CoA hydratase/carnithine racemase n=1 Tax=Micromonospora phaseoli TaxID=1144548 RepID=A0A1H7DID9_9ACTN|nr:enoyl-CoA hydratase/isomerase family protein [Micromonospora phaseoli]PZW02369.1 enoyl-CoA hydratase/carnithine racemase [Micromonospora phaseoli]GIJ75629.1 enoyl-CoA hydratase [Micromonospora phaseoli]SEK01591.1 Enoyl-CoA hydratase/carnithine racemase [Micromonospora phaseoli]